MRIRMREMIMMRLNPNCPYCIDNGTLINCNIYTTNTEIIRQSKKSKKTGLLLHKGKGYQDE